MRVVFLVLLLSFSSFLAAQEEDEYVLGDNSSSTTDNTSQTSGFDWNNVTIGGGLGMTFGDITLIEVAPTMGYYFTENIIGGVGVNYIYYEYKNFNYSTSIYGARVFGEYLFEDLPFMAHVELEVINLENDRRKRINLVNPYVGGGLKQFMGGYSYAYLLVLYNLNETNESYFLQPNPIIRLGIAIGL